MVIPGGPCRKLCSSKHDKPTDPKPSFSFGSSLDLTPSSPFPPPGQDTVLVFLTDLMRKIFHLYELLNNIITSMAPK